MELKKLPLADTRAFSSFFLDYIDQKDSLKPFYNRFPGIQHFKAQLEEKSRSFSSENREVLRKVLLDQYQQLSSSEAVINNIESLRDKHTFTITTGHQLNIFTGPLYFIYKIVTVINTCKALKKQYPQYNFVPVYWMASEDHDYDEIKYFRLYGKKYTWETAQKGAVGRFKTESMKQLLDQVPGDITIFREAYLKNKTLADAARHYVHALFGNEGLVVIDPDHRELKALFRPVMVNDVIRCETLPVVEKTNASLENLNYKTQVFCRNINFFYLDEQLRSRIEKTDGRYHVVDTDLKFSEKEMLQMIEDRPECFSPNVILRPLYQEYILPNLAYVGGPAEVVYWLQLKAVFSQYGTPFPMLMPRNFALVIEHHVLEKFKKTGLELSNLFEEKNFLFNHWVLKNSKHRLTVGPERETINAVYEDLRTRAETIDKSLAPFLGAEGKRALNSLEKIERKLLKAEKRLQSDKLRQIETVKDALFPNDAIQERTDNFLNFYQRDPQFIRRLLDLLDPFDFRFNVLTYTANDQGTTS